MKDKSKTLMKRITSSSVYARLDTQVGLLILLIVSFSCSTVGIYIYNVCYNHTINTLVDRCETSYQYLLQNLDMTIFGEVTTKDDVTKDIYEKNYNLLSQVRQLIAAKYLYTATYNEDNEYIYQIDAISMNSKDFRYPGELIETEFQDDVQRAMSGEYVISNDILSTDWGDIFTAFYPVYENKKVVGIIGISFYAHDEKQLYIKLQVFTTIFISIVCYLSSILAKHFFKRISNPHFQDIYNTDSLTGLKNRNAYDVDTNNIIHRRMLDEYTLVLADLNGLKVINDKYGHQHGDAYIKFAAAALISDNHKDYVVYRIGGDEFAILFSHQNIERIETYIKQTKNTLRDISNINLPIASLAMGWAKCEGKDLGAWESAQEKADYAMYTDKKAFYSKNKEMVMRKNRG
ncbi:hypothetical protein AN643_00075 [Candidatus Epulonipiscioides saccharophilum]|nr:hypothetical protein AN643_00075 [Epulopiscium sp. SCG-B10WGA-EpuloB]